MIFSSYPFVLLLLPAILVGCLALNRLGRGELAPWFLIAASFLFYAWWDWRLVWVLAASITVNLAIAASMERLRDSRLGTLLLLIAGISFNLLFLGYFKYTGFLANNLNVAIGTTLSFQDVVLPLGISFFTFQQIAYLVDLRCGHVTRHSLRDYVLFVSFFPQLIAGPIVRQHEMLPQLVAGRAGRLSPELFSQGLSIFVIGVAKKVLIADQIARYATPVFEAAAAGVSVPLVEAWGGALAYTFQIYFDFSAYSDMAVGLGLMVGVYLPINFNSPYKAQSLIEFWRRWHMTLSRFLRDYLYIPLAGNRKGPARRYLNIMIVMLLGGLWHGAGWTFVVWGGLHGMGLLINHAWRRLRGNLERPHPVYRAFCVVLTFGFVVVTWVVFRADDMSAAVNIVTGMAGMNGVVLPATYADHLGALAPVFKDWGVQFEAGYLYQGRSQVIWIVGLLAIVWVCPNTLAWAGYRPGAEDRGAVLPNVPSAIAWRPTIVWSLALSAIALTCLAYMSQVGEFLYFQF